MKALLILQKVIVILSGPLTVVFIALLGIPATHGSAINFLKTFIGTLCWPVGWVIGNLGTMAMMTNMRTPNWTGPVAANIAGVAFLFFGQRLHDYGDDRRPILDFIGWWLREGISLTNLLTRTAAGAGAHTSDALQSGGAASGAVLGFPWRAGRNGTGGIWWMMPSLYVVAMLNFPVLFVRGC
jgi:hypothetical protein